MFIRLHHHVGGFVRCGHLLTTARQEALRPQVPPADLKERRGGGSPHHLGSWWAFQ